MIEKWKLELIIYLIYIACMIIISMLVTVVSTFWDKGSAKESGELGNWLLDETLIDWFVAHWTDLSWRRCIWLVLTRAPRVPVASTDIYRPTTCLCGTKPHPPMRMMAVMMTMGKRGPAFPHPLNQPDIRWCSRTEQCTFSFSNCMIYISAFYSFCYRLCAL